MIIINFVLLASLGFSKTTEVYHSSPDLLEKWLGPNIDVSGNSLPEFRRTILTRIKSAAQAYLDAEGGIPINSDDNDFPYFAWIPPFVGQLTPNGNALTWESSCFKTNVASATLVNDTINITLKMERKKSLVCDDFYLFGTVEGFALEDYKEKGEYSLEWDLSKLTPAQRWDVLTNGIRVFRFVNDKLQTIGDIITTIELFVSELTKGVPDFVERKNVDFLEKYTQMPMPKRTIGKVIINESDIHSGDGLFVTRMDGLDPMLTWATGGTGHSTVFLWMDKELYVVESTVKDSYWPTNGVQKTPYLQWLKQAEEADFNVVFTPLAANYSEIFDEKAAIEYFESVEGFDYGYYNFLFGWIDTVKDNYPCIPPDYTQCLQWEHIPVLFGVIEGLAYNVTRMLVGQALNHRVGTKGESLAEVFKTANEKGMQAKDLPQIVELDTWLYETNRYGKPAVGPAQVCSTFVCSIWKAGGLFKDSIHDNVNCTELVPWDDTALGMFEGDVSKLPPPCQNITKSGQPCQILGNVHLPILGYDTRDVHSDMYERCASLPPKYAKTDDC